MRIGEDRMGENGRTGRGWKVRVSREGEMREASASFKV